MEYAGFGARFVASLIDGIIVVALTIVAGIALMPIGGETAVNLVSWVVGFGYFIALEGSPRQATFGKQAMGLAVTTVDGEPVDYLVAGLRNVAKVLSSLVLMIGYLMAAFTEKHQALHDMIAGCVVVKR